MKLFIKAFAILLIFLNPVFSQVTGLEGWDIILDPGHSGQENQGIYGYNEAPRNLRVALALREMLLTTTDIDTVYMTRTNDYQSVSLTQRTDYANRIGASWYHSIHSDAEAPPHNSTLFLWGQYYNRTEKIPNGGKAMSDIMVAHLTNGMRINTRGSIGDCSFYTGSTWCAETGGPYLHVNRTTTMPSELSEAGSHTNPKQDQLFMNAEFKKLEAQTFYWSILEFHGIERPPVGICTGIISDMEPGIPINGATVTINGQSYKTDTYESVFHKYSSDPDKLHNGFYYIENLPNETLTLTVEADDYYSDTLEVTVIDSFFTFQDIRLVSKKLPCVVSTVPADGDSGFAAWEELSIFFSRPMNRSSIENSVTITPHENLNFEWTNNDQKLTIVTDTLQYETDYTLTLGTDAVDKYNHPFDGNNDGTGGDIYTFSFSTGQADLFAPDIVRYIPERSADIIGLKPIVGVAYDEELNPQTITAEMFTLERSSDKYSVPGILKHYVVSERSSLTFFPTEKLTANERYFIRVAAGLQDLFGNEVTVSRASNFKTTGADYNATTIDNFDTEPTANWWNPQQSGSTVGIITEQTNHGENSEIVNLLSTSQNSLQLNYGWDVSAGSHLIRLYLGGGAPRNRIFESNDVLQVYIFGDGSNNQFRFAIDDNYPSTQAEFHEVSPWYTIDWIGWKLVTWDMTNDGTGTWIGNGVFDGRLRIDSIQMTYNPGGAVSGTVYFDDLQYATVSYIDVAEKNDPALPVTTDLRQNYPNPFNPQTTIRYDLPAGSHQVRLVIYDMLGKQVRTLVDGNQSGGAHSILWDGKDDSGKQVASGIYVYKLSAGKQSYTKRMTLVR